MVGTLRIHAALAAADPVCPSTSTSGASAIRRRRSGRYDWSGTHSSLAIVEHTDQGFAA
jgi:hypothetical protein